MKAPAIIYLSPFDILRPRTNQVSDVRFCEGFAQNDCEVHLIVPFAQRPDNIPLDCVNAYYGLEKEFKIHYLPTAFKDEVKGLRSLILTAWYGQILVRSILRSLGQEQKVFIISRHGALLLPYITLRRSGLRNWKNVRVIHWMHDLKRKKKDQYVYRNADALLATNNSILTDTQKLFGDKPGTYTLNPVTQAQVNERITKDQARKETGLEDISHKLIVYTGKIGTNYNKELMHILEAAALLPDYQFLFTGGKPTAIDKLKEYCSKAQIKNVTFTGYLPDYTKVRYYQYAADVLVSYYTKQGHEPQYNLPNKICEYMLTGNVIVSPDYPATRDLLSRENCWFADPENSQALADTIRYALTHEEESRLRAMKARETVEQATFKKVCWRVLEFFNQQP